MKTFEITVSNRKAIVVLNPGGGAYTGFFKNHPNVIAQAGTVDDVISNLRRAWHSFANRSRQRNDFDE